MKVNLAFDKTGVEIELPDDVQTTVLEPQRNAESTPT